ncbi:MAG TPA: succinate dehydrogenase [Casimicrobiaceae bacterium]|nr:succinate dehydrogenase [Casimicrobiaceae bacterium]
MEASVTRGIVVDDALRGARYAAWRFVLQRGSAAVLAFCVLVHLATIIYAMRHGLTAQTIVARMHASLVWPAFYALFVLACAVHAPLGLRAIADEWLAFRGRAADVVLALFALVLLGGGLYAVISLTR